jgi:hypothetical protein
MAHTFINITEDGGGLVPSQSSVSVVQGDSIAFSAPGLNAALFFSPGAISVLSPSPAAAVPLNHGHPARFTFTSSAPGAYSVFLGANTGAATPDFPEDQSNQLMIGADSPPPPPPPPPPPMPTFSGPNSSTNTG